MSKIKTAFFCSNCGYESAKWIGKCPACSQWNTFTEEILDKGNVKEEKWDDYKEEKRKTKTISLNEVQTTEEKRIKSQDPELDRVLGGGIVPGSIVLVAGEPGIGKSTLFLQNGLLLKQLRVLYISGEESEQQIKMRADRLKIQNENFYLLTETSTQTIFQEIKKLKPQLVIVDSIQTLQSNLIDSSAGTVSQIRECAAEFQRFAKETNTPVFLIGHITKDGAIAGPKVLEHMVDTVLQFEGDRHYAYRILRTLKNRFGSTAELGIYEMTGDGMRVVANPSEILIAQREDQLSGSGIAATLEGMRPLLIEVQALVTQSVYGTPQRTVTGFDTRRLQLLLAVLEKRGGFQFGMKDVFVNIAGGIKVEDPSIDLAVICALLSSYEDVPLPPHVCFAGEVGLNGEIRAVNKIEQRIAEAEKLGFEKIFVSKYNKKSFNPQAYKIQVVALSRVDEVYQQLF
ncbi:MAG: DNA repair protein RadA [Sediminibacterium sp. Gen4]|jgi:DNA repair protein RadA/Sms|uniref:DNA repair protein RadA n=1 Tax=unclassified Sediminibacterium TaxID=2635961 RepID=UPI0015BBC0C2|nr:MULTISPECIES: DNA repair protein RadA [unclassified Sediminibacterium]MBW0163883.1 DNA repair protein RadA [Sediminibacterium sp.]NWK66330.1 DNA repair protein RadA [Sediminibacterium sp. Gen4]